MQLFEMNITAIGGRPTHDALFDAVEAAKAALKRHGFEITRTGYGVRRVSTTSGTTLPWAPATVMPDEPGPLYER